MVAAPFRIEAAGISSKSALQRGSLFLILFAIGNILGPLLLGPLFDTIGDRRVMISFTYITSAVVMIITGLLYARGSQRDARRARGQKHDGRPAAHPNRMMILTRGRHSLASGTNACRRGVHVER